MSQSSQSFLTGCRSVHLTFEVRLQGPYLSPPTPRQRDLLCRPPGHASNPSPHHPHGHPLHVSAGPRPRTRLPAPALPLWSVLFLRAQRSSPNTNLNKAPPSQNPSLPPRCSLPRPRLAPPAWACAAGPADLHITLFQPRQPSFSSLNMSGPRYIQALHRLFLLSRTFSPVPSPPTSFGSYFPSDHRLNFHFLPFTPTSFCVFIGH